LCKPLTLGGTQLAVAALTRISAMDQDDEQSIGPALKACCDILDMSVVGWGNMLDWNVAKGEEPKPLDFSPALLREVLVLDEAMELVTKLVQGQELSADDKKKYASRATSARRRGAKGARVGGA
jgi:hypothetical protein